jgi:hypothetical protein
MTQNATCCDLFGDGQQRHWDGKIGRLGSLHIDDHLLDLVSAMIVVGCNPLGEPIFPIISISFSRRHFGYPERNEQGTIFTSSLPGSTGVPHQAVAPAYLERRPTLD